MKITQTGQNRAAWLKGGQAHCNTIPDPPVQTRRLVLLGAPGAGKGTQAELLSERLGACHLSTGDIFRAAKTLDACERTPTMSRAMEYMVHGDLVPDDTVLQLVAERTGCLGCRAGFLLDGFPRTVAQAEALNHLLAAQKVALDAVLSYDMPLEKIVARLSGRRTCSICQAVFHLDTRPPITHGMCDHCGAPLTEREDDRPESIRVRMDAYIRSTSPLVEFYERKGLLISIAAEGAPEQVLERTIEALEKK